MNKISVGFLIAMILSLPAAGQSEVPMADGLRAEGKIYVVVIIVLIVLAGLIGYLFLTDRKLNRLEKMLRDRQKQTN